MKKILERLERAQDKYSSTIRNAKVLLEGKILFPFYITYLHPSGWVLGSLGNDWVSPLDLVMEVVLTDGSFTLEDHELLSL